MDAKEFNRALRRLGACEEAREWAKGKSLTEVYEQLHRADWWLWLAARAGVDRRRVVLAACACARTALKHLPEAEKRPLEAIETAERWARDEDGVTLEQVREGARKARAAAAAAAYAADAAADAAAAAYAADAAAADAAAAAAAYAAYAAAAYAAAYADAADARKKTLLEMMAVVREHLPLELVEAALSRTPAEVTSAP